MPFIWGLYHLKMWWYKSLNDIDDCIFTRGQFWSLGIAVPLRWRHNDNDGVSNHQPHGCLLKRLFRRRSKKTSKLCVTGLCVGNSPGPVNSPHKGPVTRKMFPFDDVIMSLRLCVCVCLCQPQVYPRDDKSPPIQARITNFGQKVHNTLITIPLVLGVDWSRPPWSNLTWKSEFHIMTYLATRIKTQ